MRTREQLLALADEYITKAAKYGGDYAGIAQACVALARELRESAEAPTFEQVNRLTEALDGIRDGQ